MSKEGNIMEQFKHINIDEILDPYAGYMLTPLSMKKIKEEYEQKEQDWLNSERMD